MKKKIEIVAVRNKITHLGSHAGYDQIYSFLQKYNQFSLHSSWRKEFNGLENFLNLATLLPFRWFFGNKFFTLNHMKANIEAEKLSIALKADIVHFSHWEDCYSSPFLFLSKNKHIKIIATSHQPVSCWQKNVRTLKAIERLNALIVLSTAEKVFFEKLIPGKVHVVAHGIDTDFFTPAKQSNIKDYKSCVFAGNWLRNIPLLVKIVSIVTSKRKDIHFNVINQHINNKRHPIYQLRNNKNVSLYKNISDEELRDVYRKSAVMVLPLIDSTANNGLMEAAACGLPVIVSDVGGVRDYTNNSFCEYVPLHSNADAFSEKILNLLDDTNAIDAKGKKASAFMSENFNWALIADKTAYLYQKLHET